MGATTVQLPEYWLYRLSRTRWHATWALLFTVAKHILYSWTYCTYQQWKTCDHVSQGCFEPSSKQRSSVRQLQYGTTIIVRCDLIRTKFSKSGSDTQSTCNTHHEKQYDPRNDTLMLASMEWCASRWGSRLLPKILYCKHCCTFHRELKHAFPDSRSVMNELPSFSQRTKCNFFSHQHMNSSHDDSDIR